MEIKSAHRRIRRLWLVWPLFALAAVLGAAKALFEWPPSVLLGATAVWIVIMFLILQLAGARMEWDLALSGERDWSLQVYLQATAMPPFGRYVVLLDGAELLSQTAGWGLVDRLEFDLGQEPTRRALATVTNRNLWPLRPIRLALEIDGRRLAGL